VIRTCIKTKNNGLYIKSYEETYLNFELNQFLDYFTWRQNGYYNLVYEAVDRWVDLVETADKIALIYDHGGESISFSFRKIKELSCQWANMFVDLSLGVGDYLVIFTTSQLKAHLAMLAAVRLGAIFCPLSLDLTSYELHRQISSINPKIILTDSSLAHKFYRNTLNKKNILLLTSEKFSGCHIHEKLVNQFLPNQSKECAPNWVHPEHPLYLVFVPRGDTPPRGIIHVHGVMVNLLITGCYVLNLGKKSLCWTDWLPGQIVTLLYGSLVPWLCGSGVLMLGDEFSPSTCYRILERYNLSTWFTRSKNIDRLKQAGNDLFRQYNLNNIGHVVTVGSEISPKTFFWFHDNFDRYVYHTCWNFEVGMIALANFPGQSIKFGSTGLPVPGIHATVVDGLGHSQSLLSLGDLAFKSNYPFMFYKPWETIGWEDSLINYNWHFCNKFATIDEDGYFYLYGYKENVVEVLDRLLSSYEVEQALSEHPMVAECAVIQIITGKIVQLKCFVVLYLGCKSSLELREALKALVYTNVSPFLPLVEIEFILKLPRNSNQLLLRRVLRAKELGLPIGNQESLQNDWAN